MEDSDEKRRALHEAGELRSRCPEFGRGGTASFRKPWLTPIETKLGTGPRRFRWLMPEPRASFGPMQGRVTTGDSPEPRRRLCQDRASNPSLRGESGAGKQGKTCFSGLGSDPLMLALGNSPLCMEAGGGRLHLHTLPSPQKKSKTRAKGSFQGSWRFGCASL